MSLNKFPVFARPNNYWLVDDKFSALESNTLLMFIDETTAFKLSSLSQDYLQPFKSKVSVFTEIEEKGDDGEESEWIKVFNVINPNDPRKYIDVELSMQDLHLLYKMIVPVAQTLKNLGVDLTDKFEFKEYDNDF
jgi:hypothetical protein